MAQTFAAVHGTFELAFGKTGLRRTAQNNVRRVRFHEREWKEIDRIALQSRWPKG